MHNFVGTKNKKIVVDGVITKRLYRSSWKKTDYLYLMKNSEGDIITFTTPAKFQEGEGWQITGTVKKHTIFHGMLQTHVVKWAMKWSPKNKKNDKDQR